MSTKKEKELAELDGAARAREVRANLTQSLAACERAIAKLTRHGRHVEAQKYVAMRATLKKRLEQADNVAKILQELEQNKDLRSFFAKTAVLCISAVDLATFYADTIDKFLARHDAIKNIETEEAEKAGRKALECLRRIYAGRLTLDLKEAGVSLFDDMERTFAKNTFTDREMVYYKEYSE